MVKKYLLGSIAAMATMMFATSCSNEDAFDSAQDINVAKYEAKFIQKFGKPSPTQTWGFGNSSSSTRAINPIFDFPSDCDESKFLADVPEGVSTYDALAPYGGYNSGVSYIENRTSKVAIWGGWDGSKTSGGTLYIKGNCDFTSSEFYVASNTDIYLVEGATLTLSAAQASDLQSGCNFYVARNAKIYTEAELVLNTSVHIYNHGTIEVGKLSVNGASVLYNSNKVKVNGELSAENSNSVIVNDGEISATRLHTAGSSHVQNNADFTISGNTDIDSNNNTWVNNGQYTTRNFNYTAGSCDVINNCHLTVTNQFYIGLGDSPTNGFRMDANSGVEANSFLAEGPGYIFMGSNSVFKVANTATMDITKDNYGIFGPESGDYAVFQAKDIVNGAADPNQGFVANYFQNVYVVAETHFAQGYSDKSAEQQAAGEIGAQPYYHVGNNAFVYTGGEKPGITIPKSTCNPGFGGGDDFTPVIRVMAEDLTVNDGSDFDFNDVVFDVQWTATGAKIRLNAAGGTLPLTIEGVEVHAKFAEANPGKNITTKTMMNTAENARDAYVKPIFEITGNFKNGDVNDANLIKVMVNKGTAEKPNWLELKAEKGKVAAKIGVEPKCDWCYERQDIERKYSNFAKWVRGEVETFY